MGEERPLVALFDDRRCDFKMELMNVTLCEVQESENNSDVSRKRNQNSLLNANATQGTIHTSNLAEEKLSAVQEFHEFAKSVLLAYDDEIILNDGTEGPRIQNQQLQKMLWETATLKSMKAMQYIPSEILVRLLTILGSNISSCIPQYLKIESRVRSEQEVKRKLNGPGTAEKILEATNASICTLYILTSESLPSIVLIEDVIDKVVELSEFLLKNLVYPFCDQNFETKYIIDISFKNGHSNNKKANEKFMSLYNKVVEIVSLLSELVTNHLLTDDAILHITYIAITPFYVENVGDLQFAALKLAVGVFKKYEHYRRLILNNILESTGQLMRNKLRTKSFRLNSTDCIKMQSALILQIVQCTVILPEDIKVLSEKGKGHSTENIVKPTEKYDLITHNCDSIISTRYDSALRVAQYFLKGFLNKCEEKKGEIDYKFLFENFIQDLLLALNKPEWPVAELFINLLGHLLTSNIQNKSTDISLRTMSLECLSLIATKLKKESIQAQLHSGTVLKHLKEMKSGNFNILEENSCEKKIKLARKESNSLLESEDHLLQSFLLDYLSTKKTTDQSLISAKHYYVVKWYKESLTKSNGSNPSPKNIKIPTKSREKRRKGSSNKSKKIASKNSTHSNQESDTRFSNTFLQSYKHFLIFKLKSIEVNISTQTELKPNLDNETAELITQYLATKSLLYENFNIYLRQILSVLTESSSIIRAKAMKCLTSVIEVDPTLLERTYVHQGVCYSFLDQSVLVREAAVDLIGKYVLIQSDLLEQYYEMLSSRLLDTGISVRKRVLKILKDICIKCPDFPKIPEICSKIARRMNDQETIKKLVIEAFQEMWFSPIHANSNVNSTQLLQKVANIVKVIASLQKTDLVFFEQLFKSLLRGNSCDSVVSHETSPPLLKSWQEIVCCLFRWVLKSEEGGFSSSNAKLHSSHFFVACFSTLHLFAKSCPALLLDYMNTLEPYLSIQCHTQGDLLIVKYVAQTIHHVLPLIQHPSETFVAQLEEDLLKLILLYDPTVIENCISCLSIVVNKITKNFKLIGDLFKRFYNHLTEYKYAYEKNPSSTELIKKHPYIRRCLFTIGPLFKHFDFTNGELTNGFSKNTVEDVFILLVFFLQNMTEDIQIYSLKAIGSICISHSELMTREELVTLFNFFLISNNSSPSMINQVLWNLYVYLKEEDSVVMKLEKEITKSQKNENLKELGNSSYDRVSKVVQLYNKGVMESCLNGDITIRHSSLKLLQLVIHQGLIQPFQMMPYLIGLATDENITIRQMSEALMEDIEKKHPGTMHMKSQEGFVLSFKLHTKCGQNGQNHTSKWVRGFQVKENAKFEALNGVLYSCIRKSIKARRALVTNLLKRFENQSQENLKLLLFVADNLAYFPYVLLDEPLFVIYLIDTMILVCGSYVTDNFHEVQLQSHKPSNSKFSCSTYIPILKESGNETTNFLKIPQDQATLQKCVSAIQSCFLLVDLKDHLQTLYSVSNEKIMQYSPEKSTRASEKNTKHGSTKEFNPRIIVHNSTIEANMSNAEKKALLKQFLLLKEIINPD